MLEFLLNLKNGIRKVPKEHAFFITRLKQKNLCDKSKNGIKLKSGLDIGRLDRTRFGTYIVDEISRHKSFKASRKTAKMISEKEFKKGMLVIFEPPKYSSDDAKVLEIITQDALLCYIDTHKNKVMGFRFYDRTKTPIPLPLSQRSLRALPRFCVLKVDLRSKKVLEILGVMDDPAIDERLLLEFYSHPNSITLDSKTRKNEGAKISKDNLARSDLTHINFYTIDPKGAKDLDDAIFYDAKDKILYVAIADVSAYVSFGHEIDLLARERGFSLYLPNRTHHMLPEILSSDLCSLKANTLRPSMVFKINLDTFESHLMLATIKVQENLNYDDVDLLLENKANFTKEISQNIKKWHAKACALREERLKRGFSFVDSEIRLKLDRGGHLQKVKAQLSSDSHMIIEEAMLLANRAAAMLLSNSIYAHSGIYRVHESIKKDKEKALFASLCTLGFDIRGDGLHEKIRYIQKQASDQGKSEIIDSLIIKAQSKALYEPRSSEHFALGFLHYTHFTSPIRRYSDLLLHYLLKLILSGQRDSKNIASQMEGFCAMINDAEKRISKIEFGFMDRKFAHHAKRAIGKKVKAFISNSAIPPIAIAKDKIKTAKIYLTHAPRHINFQTLDDVIVELIDVDLSDAKIYGRFVDFDKRKKDV